MVSDTPSDKQCFGSLGQNRGRANSDFPHEIVCLQFWSMISLSNAETWADSVVHHWTKHWFAVSRLFSSSLSQTNTVPMQLWSILRHSCQGILIISPCGKVPSDPPSDLEFQSSFPQGVSKLTSRELHSRCPGLGSRLQTQRDTEAFRDPCKFLCESESGGRRQREAALLLRLCKNIGVWSRRRCTADSRVCAHVFIYTSYIPFAVEPSEISAAALMNS